MVVHMHFSVFIWKYQNENENPKRNLDIMSETSNYMSWILIPICNDIFIAASFRK